MSLIVTRSNGTSDITFTLQNQVGTQKNFNNAAAGLAEPEQITLQSFLRPLGAKGSDRYSQSVQDLCRGHHWEQYHGERQVGARLSSE
jgi:hypothetical protein